MESALDFDEEFYENNFDLLTYLSAVSETRRYPNEFLDILNEVFANSDSCFDEMHNEEGMKRCMENYYNYYTDAESWIANVEDGAEIYRGLKVDPRKYRQFVSDLQGLEWDTLDYWLKGYRTKYVPQRAGKYWTWSFNNANEYGAEIREKDRDVDDIVLVAANPTDIDEYETKRHAVIYQDQEKEIRLEDNSEVFLKKICNWQKGYKECVPYKENGDWINVGSHYYKDEFMHFKYLE